MRRAGVSLDTVIRNYVAAYTLVETFIVEEAERSEDAGEGGPLRGILGARASLIDRLLTAITGAYGDGSSRRNALPSGVARSVWRRCSPARTSTRLSLAMTSIGGI